MENEAGNVALEVSGLLPALHWDYDSDRERWVAEHDQWTFHVSNDGYWDVFLSGKSIDSGSGRYDDFQSGQLDCAKRDIDNWRTNHLKSMLGKESTVNPSKLTWVKIEDSHNKARDKGFEYETWDHGLAYVTPLGKNGKPVEKNKKAINKVTSKYMGFADAEKAVHEWRRDYITRVL